jgi:hypothetical protein
MINKKAVEMNFSLIFSIIAGAAILFLAIYAASQFIETRRYEIDTQTAAKLSILLDPLETSLESGKSSLIHFDAETRIYNECYDYGNFGKQTISIAKKSRGREWQDPGGDTQLYNKYIFSSEREQGQDFGIFTKPLKMPFKISDLIFFSGKDYCFVNAPEDLKDELEGLSIKGVNFTTKNSDCSMVSEKVCFLSSAGCDITVYPTDSESGNVVKNGATLYYTDSLLYGAIFSSPEVYECNVKRLMLRLVNLCFIYKDKIEILESKGCSSLLDSHLSELIGLARGGAGQLAAVKEKADEINMINSVADCRLY